MSVALSLKSSWFFCRIWYQPYH